MSYPTFNNDEDGIRAANRALQDIRALLQERTWLSSSAASADSDFALRFQMENLEDMLREITDARFARSLSEQGSVRVALNEHVATLQFIVSTAREMVFEMNRPPPVPPKPASTLGKGGDATSSSNATSSRGSGSSSIFTSTSRYGPEYDRDNDLGLQINVHNAFILPNFSPLGSTESKGKQRETFEEDIAPGSADLFEDDDDDVVLLHGDCRDIPKRPQARTTPWFQDLGMSLPQQQKIMPERDEPLPMNSASTTGSTLSDLIYTHFGWNSLPSDKNGGVDDSQPPSPTLSMTDFLSTFDNIKRYEVSSSDSDSPSGGSSTQSFSSSLYSDSCIACGDHSDIIEPLIAPCGHQYCRTCVSRLVKVYNSDETLHPLRCCQTAIPISSVELLLSDTNDLSQFRDKCEEYDTPHEKRTYCPQRGCHRFITFTKPPAGSVTSRRWAVAVCVLCKELAHPGEHCDEKENTSKLHELVKEKQWQTCSNCHSIVERIDGCLHMICRSRSMSLSKEHWIDAIAQDRRGTSFRKDISPLPLTAPTNVKLPILTVTRVRKHDQAVGRAVERSKKCSVIPFTNPMRRPPSAEEVLLADANRALNDFRLLLRRRSADPDDKKHALRYQLETLEDMLRIVVDSRYARSLAGLDDVEGSEHRASRDFLRYIVSTARGVTNTDVEEPPLAHSGTSRQAQGLMQPTTTSSRVVLENETSWIVLDPRADEQLGGLRRVNAFRRGDTPYSVFSHNKTRHTGGGETAVSPSNEKRLSACSSRTLVPKRHRLRVVNTNTPVSPVTELHELNQYTSAGYQTDEKTASVKKIAGKSRADIPAALYAGHSHPVNTESKAISRHTSTPDNRQPLSIRSHNAGVHNALQVTIDLDSRPAACEISIQNGKDANVLQEFNTGAQLPNSMRFEQANISASPHTLASPERLIDSPMGSSVSSTAETKVPQAIATSALSPTASLISPTRTLDSPSSGISTNRLR
ncbi:hypothetical protein NP233_g1984 [Leucocoprinus birnbaumii]|uniref:RING-type domain-containing protein n=1 Tax=Leucocoprinus birnbaumii TaxID=56174 RepID=A0AAD5VZ61_9AGAR|nr:hypothetical protein NP233_g1984 [Leucocoprinus birnbaumii]